MSLSDVVADWLEERPSYLDGRGLKQRSRQAITEQLLRGVLVPIQPSPFASSNPTRYKIADMTLDVINA